MNLNIYLDKKRITPSYRKYRIVSEKNDVGGYIVLELYESTWNLELMSVIPTGKGIGTYLLKYVLEKEVLDPKHMTVCPISEEAERFFKKQGFFV